MHVRATGVVLVFFAFARAASAQCTVDKESNEAKLLAFYAAPLAFSPAGSIGQLRPGAVRIGIDLTPVPRPGSDITTTSNCFPTQNNRTRLAPFFPRPRLAIGLPGGFFVEGMYLPPVTVVDATPSLGSVALGWTRPMSAILGVALRAHGTFGHVKGPITCPLPSLQHFSADDPCFGTVPSEDTYEPNVFGAEGALTFGGAGKLTGYVGAGAARYEPRFHVGFTSGDGIEDRTLVQTTLNRAAVMAGGNYRLFSRAAVTAEVYSVPVDVTVFRVGATWILR